MTAATHSPGILAQRAAVVAEALSWLGTPWVHAARIKGAGVDCGQFLADVFERAGVVAHVPTPAYAQDWALHRSEEVFRGIVEQYARPLPSGAAPAPGDVLLFRFGRCLSHGGIVVEGRMFVHAYLNAGRVVVDSLDNNGDLAARCVGAWSPWTEVVR